MKLQKKDANGSKTYNVEECLEKISGINDTVDDINAKLKKVSGIAAGAEVNQKAFSNVKIGSTTIAADSKTDTLNIVAGSNITLTPDATNDKITIATTNTPTFTNLTTTNLTANGEIEVYGAIPHIDFHYGNSTNDYTSRIIEDAAGAIDILAPNGLKLNGSNLKYDDTAIKNRLTNIENKENVTLTANTARISNVSYTAKYFPLLGMVFVRIYGKINATLNTGYDYDLFTINSRVPNSNTALSVKCGKDAMANAKTASGSGVIQIRPLESGISGYDVYIAGFWFV